MSIQIPNLHTSNKTTVLIRETATVGIQSRKDATHAGTFKVKGLLQFDPSTNDYPTGNMNIIVDLSDSAQGEFIIKTVEQLDSCGKHNPTAYATGRCLADVNQKVVGCRYWLMFADNKQATGGGTPDIISFLIFDRNGKRVAYGTGPVKGDLIVTPSGE